jgi:hypothetical protein
MDHMATLRCKEPFAADIKGVPRVVPAGALVDSNDPVVKGREHLFEPVDAFMERRTADVEQATAAPGEKRSIAKKAAPKGDD